MIKKILSLIFIAAILLSACGAQAPEEATEAIDAAVDSATETSVPATKTEEPTSTPVSEDISTPTLEPTLIPTATLPPPENAADCTNEAVFVSDITVPDYSDLNIGEAFTKTWEIRNTGTCIWWSGYTLSHYSESSFSAPESVPLPHTNAGETAIISIDLIAPDVAGTYQGNFVIKNPDELIMQVNNDSRLWLIFNTVDSGTTVLSEPTEIPDDEEAEGASCDFLREDSRIDGVFAAVNTYRAASGLPPYNMNYELIDAAQAHAADMACNSLFVHTGSDGSTPETRAVAAGFVGAKVTENVYGSSPPLSPEEAKEWWRTDTVDPTHNLNLISTEYTEIGIGYAFYDNFGYYVVVFGTP